MTLNVNLLLCRQFYVNCDQTDEIRIMQFLPKRDLSLGICRCNSICHLSVTFMHPKQPVKIFGNVSIPFCILAIH